MSQMLNESALHDLGHIRQIAELARARKYQAVRADLERMIEGSHPRSR